MADSKPLKLGYKLLGGTGLRVSELCLGAMTFGGAWGMPHANEEESFAMLDRFVEVGGNFIDTANSYGESEQVIGNWLTKRGGREHLVIATKVFWPLGKGPNEGGCSRKHILYSLERSLKRLQTDYIDLYQLHAFDSGTPIREVFSTLNTLAHEGKIRYIGVSNYTAGQLQEVISLTREYGWENVVCLQPQYSLLCRYIEWDVLDVCRRNNIAVIPWSPLAGGLLSGRYRRGEAAAEGSRVEWAGKNGLAETSLAKHDNDRTWRVLDVLDKIAAKHSSSVAQVALRWVMQREGVTAPIIGAKRMSQLEENLAAAALKLTPEDMSELDGASAIEVPYPWGMEKKVTEVRSRIRV